MQTVFDGAGIYEGAHSPLGRMTVIDYTREFQLYTEAEKAAGIEITPACAKDLKGMTLEKLVNS